MQGQLLNFSPQSNTGYISGKDGKRYQFTGSEWKENETPQKGDHLDFEVDASGQAVCVFFALNSLVPGQKTTALEDRYLSSPQAMEKVYRIEANYNMFDWFIKSLKKYASFSGRARRKEYWYFQLCLFLLYVVTGFLDALLHLKSLIIFIVFLTFILPNVAISIRRLHDINRSGWWWCINAIPVIGNIICIVWLATETKYDVNKWGAPAKPQNG